MKNVGNVLYALGANLLITIGKAVIGFWTRSPATLAEAAHSLADSTTEVMLLLGKAHAKKDPKMEYAWALIASMLMFALGGVYSIWEGIDSLVNPEVGGGSPYWDIAVLSGAIIIESTSWLRAARSLAVTRGQKSWVQHLRTVQDPANLSIFMEDGIDVSGNVGAIFGIVVHMVTGDPAWQSFVSIVIGISLMGVAYHLAAQNVRVLTGREELVIA